jgi:hypothetical protein
MDWDTKIEGSGGSEAAGNVKVLGGRRRSDLISSWGTDHDYSRMGIRRWKF